jgi:hypothetical protein
MGGGEESQIWTSEACYFRATFSTSVQTLFNFSNRYVLQDVAQAEFCISQNRARTHTHMEVQLNSNLQHTGTRSPAAWLPHCLCYRPEVFFHYYCVIEPSFSHGKIWCMFQKRYFNFYCFLKKHKSKTAILGHCVSWRVSAKWKPQRTTVCPSVYFPPSFQQQHMASDFIAFNHHTGTIKLNSLLHKQGTGFNLTQLWVQHLTVFPGLMKLPHPRGPIVL